MGKRVTGVYQDAADLAGQGVRFAMALVLEANGSTPQRAGARALIQDDGSIVGTIGGGLVEAEARRRGIEACASGRPTLFETRMDHEYSRNAGAICGGRMRILIDPGAAKDAAYYHLAAEALRLRKPGVLLTRVAGGEGVVVSTRWFSADTLPDCGDFPGPEAIGACMARQSPRLFAAALTESDSPAETFVEPVFPAPILLIVGGGHVAQALAHQAVMVGFEVNVIEDRVAYANPALFPDSATIHCGDIPAGVAAFPVGQDTYIVLLTRGHKCDAEALEACIHGSAAYLGMIGSKRKVAMIKKDFLRSGLATEDELDRIFAPVGFEIGAVTVPEIATSIAAELIAVRRNGSARVRARRRPS